MAVVLLVISLFVILAGSTYFTNGVEWIGEGLGLSEGAVGSVLAAVGTALPETALPFVAILSGHPGGKDIGVGSILGGPFMLGTLAMATLGGSVLLFARRGTRPPRLEPRVGVVRQDLGYFCGAFSLAVLAGLLHNRPVRFVLAGLLLLGYGFYVRRHFRSPDEREVEAEAAGEVHPLAFRSYLLRLRGRPRAARSHPALWQSVAQTLVALALIVVGASVFVSAIGTLAERLGVPNLPFALLVAPVATELPELSNSVLWIRRSKDTLAMGNVTGAMVFQSTFPVTIGLLSTPWRLSGDALAAALIALSSAFVVWSALRLTGRLRPSLLLLFAGLFAGYATWVVATL